jgi:secreted trypsin-like serine protease
VSEKFYLFYFFVNLLSTFSAFDTQYVNAMGFGFFNYFEPVQAKILQKVSLQILPVDKCRDSQLNDMKMCTYEKGKDSCISDSGSPLLFFVRGRQFLVGLISYGIGCGTLNPSVNTRITSFLPWILNHTAGEMFCRK